MNFLFYKNILVLFFIFIYFFYIEVPKNIIKKISTGTSKILQICKKEKQIVQTKVTKKTPIFRQENSQLCSFLRNFSQLQWAIVYIPKKLFEKINIKNNSPSIDPYTTSLWWFNNNILNILNIFWWKGLVWKSL